LLQQLEEDEFKRLDRVDSWEDYKYQKGLLDGVRKTIAFLSKGLKPTRKEELTNVRRTGYGAEI
jgi:hypothetical protein